MYHTKNILTGIFIGLGLVALINAAFGSVFRSMTVVSDANISTITCATATTNGELCVENDIEANGNLDIAGTSTLTGAITAGTVAGTVLSASTSFTSPIVATSSAQIRFCGNGPDGATTTYMGPVLLDDTEADLAFGGAGCDGLESTTESTADEAWHAGFALKPVAMTCVGLCTGASAANDTIVFQLKDDTAAVSGVTCTTAALGGDGVPAQCSVRTVSASTIAAASKLDVSITMTNDDCNDAGDDFECILTVTF